MFSLSDFSGDAEAELIDQFFRYCFLEQEAWLYKQLSSQSVAVCLLLFKKTGAAMMEADSKYLFSSRIMTYCVGLLLETGLVMASDSRTNAGVDHVATFPKMTNFSIPGERVLVVLTSGNLAISQAVVSHLHKAIAENIEPNLHSVTSMFNAARIVGDALRAVHHEDAEHLRKHQAEFNQAILLGGQIKGESPRLFNIYAAGNFIEACGETPYFQIGETKYGKPILDRVIENRSDLNEAAKCTLISFDSTIRSNLSVGTPIDLMVYKSGSFTTDCMQRITDGDPYFSMLRKRWAEGLRRVFAEIPNPDWCR